jgi:hypothetical protein
MGMRQFLLSAAEAFGLAFDCAPMADPDNRTAAADITTTMSNERAIRCFIRTPPFMLRSALSQHRLLTKETAVVGRRLLASGRLVSLV